MFAYGLNILNHSSLGRRDRRLSTGGVGTPPDETVVGDSLSSSGAIIFRVKLCSHVPEQR